MTTLFSFDTPLMSSAIEAAVPANFIAAMLVAGHADHPFVMSKLAAGVGSPSVEVSWMEWTRRLGVYTPSSAQTSSDTVIVIDTTSGLRVGDVLLNENGGVADTGLELLLVSAIGSSPAQITVTRGFSGTTPQDLAVARPLKLVGSAAIEGADHSDTLSKAFKLRQNYTQIQKEDFTISNSNLVSAYHGGESPLQVMLRGAYSTLIEKVSRTLVQGGANASGLAGDGSTARHCDGIIEMCRTGSAAGDGGIFTNASGADFGTAATAWDNFNDYLKAVAELGGKPSAVLASGRVASQLSRDGALSIVQGADGVAYRNVAFIKSVFGDLPIYSELTAVPDSACVFVNEAEVKWHWLGMGADMRSIKLQEIGPTGDARKFQLICEGAVSARGAYSGNGFSTLFGLGA